MGELLLERCEICYEIVNLPRGERRVEARGHERRSPGGVGSAGDDVRTRVEDGLADVRCSVGRLAVIVRVLDALRGGRGDIGERRTDKRDAGRRRVAGEAAGCRGAEERLTQRDRIVRCGRPWWASERLRPGCRASRDQDRARWPTLGIDLRDPIEKRDDLLNLQVAQVLLGMILRSRSSE